MIVGIIGLGSIACKHIGALRSINPDTSFYALRRSHDAKKKEGVENIFSYDTLKALKPDFIIVSNPTACHRKVIENLADSNIPLFIEKPLQDDLSSLPDVKGQTYVACNLRFLNCLQYLKTELRGQRINEVNAYCGSYLPEWRPGTDWRKCYSANAELGGGVHIDLIHEVDYLYWLFGKPENVRRTFRNVSSLGISAYDYANYVMEYDEFTASVILNYYRRDYRRTLEIVTETDTWKVDLAQNSIMVDGKQVYKSSQTFADTYLSQMQYFIDSIERGGNFNDIAEAFEVLKICLDNES